MAGLIPRSSARLTTRPEEEVLAGFGSPRNEYIPTDLFGATYQEDAVLPQMVNAILSMPSRATPTPDSIAQDLDAALSPPPAVEEREPYLDLPRTGSTEELREAAAENPRDDVINYEQPKGEYEPVIRTPQPGAVSERAAGKYLTIINDTAQEIADEEERLLSARKRRPRFPRQRKAVTDIYGARGTLALGGGTRGAAKLGSGQSGKKQKLGE